MRRKSGLTCQPWNLLNHQWKPCISHSYHLDSGHDYSYLSEVRSPGDRLRFRFLSDRLWLASQFCKSMVAHPCSPACPSTRLLRRLWTRTYWQPYLQAMVSLINDNSLIGTCDNLMVIQLATNSLITYLMCEILHFTEQTASCVLPNAFVLVS